MDNQTRTGQTTTGSVPDGMRFALVAIPLRRPDVSGFLRDWRTPARGAAIAVIEQRPPAAYRDDWLRAIAQTSDADRVVDRVLDADTAMAHVGMTTTDRLVPRDLLDDETYLERNLGGWAPVWFDALGVDPDAVTDDPLLRARESLVDYGARIDSRGADPELVAARLPTEHDGGAAALRRGADALLHARSETRGSDARAGSVAVGRGIDLVGDLVSAIRGDGPLADAVGPLFAYDELIEQLFRIEIARRDAAADDQIERERELRVLQRRHEEQLGVRLMLKGEYIMGRHRRSTILLAEGLDVVAKQPAPEPDHEIDLDVRTYHGDDEHWPRAIDRGAMVTPRADIAQVVGSTAVERLNKAFGRDVRFSTALGLSIEPFEQGPTLADLARERPGELTADRYDQILVHQLACEWLDIDNPDWHAANFMVTDDGLVHVDWGAARPIPDDEQTREGRRARLRQVRQLAWSFHDVGLAERTHELHDRATSDRDHMHELRARARALVA